MRAVELKQDMPYISSIIEKFQLNDLEDMGQGQKSFVRHTPHASDHVCLIWKESIKNCMRYRADNRGSKRTNRQTDTQTDGKADFKIPPLTSLRRGYNKDAVLPVSGQHSLIKTENSH